MDWATAVRSVGVAGRLVSAVTTFDGGDCRYSVLAAMTRKRYTSPAVKVASEYAGVSVGAFPMVAKSVQLPPVQRCTMNIVSLFDWSTQVRSTCVAETAVAARPVGASGVTLLTSAGSEYTAPKPFIGRTRYRSNASGTGDASMKFSPGDIEPISTKSTQPIPAQRSMRTSAAVALLADHVR